MKINISLSGLPNFKSCPNTPDGKPGPNHFGTIHINTTIPEVEDAYIDALAGRPSHRPIVEMTIPSTLDPTLAPPGHHVASLFVQYVPYHLKNGKWDEETKKKYSDRVFDVIDEYAPGFKKLVIHRDVLAPPDLERIFGLTGGNIMHGSMSLDQLMWMRPSPGFGNYQMPIEGLYLCGAGAHPGGGVMGACGRNAAKKLISSL